MATILIDGLTELNTNLSSIRTTINIIKLAKRLADNQSTIDKIGDQIKYLQDMDFNISTAIEKINDLLNKGYPEVNKLMLPVEEYEDISLDLDEINKGIGTDISQDATL